jgi:hypothetical protein
MINLRLGLVVLGATLSCCAAPPKDANLMRVEFLTRDGCAGSLEMRANLNEAIAGLRQQVRVDAVDVATLAQTDYRTGYGTPTILIEGEDLLGIARSGPAAPT